MDEAALVRRFAPYLFFSPDETHFPGEPEEFRRVSRFRQSNWSGKKDRGWRTNPEGWVNPGANSPDFRGPKWTSVLTEIEKETRALRPGGVQPSHPERDLPQVARCRDSRNLWDKGDARGFFLELPEGYGRVTSGATPSAPVSIFYDLVTFTAEGTKWVVLYYWFFYIYNYFVVFEHEGDWEHISLYFHATDFSTGALPSCVYYAAHNTGLVLDSAHESMEWFDDQGQLTPDGTHPGVYVSNYGHPSYPSKSAEFRRKKKLRPWRSWEQPVVKIETQPWSLYDGAWGEVGEFVHSTGPLGPLFKRVDEVTHPKE